MSWKIRYGTLLAEEDGLVCAPTQADGRGMNLAMERGVRRAHCHVCRCAEDDIALNRSAGRQ